MYRGEEDVRAPEEVSEVYDPKVERIASTIMQSKKSTVAYCRTASVPQRGPSPIDHQKTTLRRVAKRRGITIRRFYCDGDISGLTLNRPSLRELLRDCGAGRIETVIIESPERLARNGKLYRTVEERLRGAGVRLVVAKGRNSSVFEDS